jgi:hypothetical protein
MAWMIIIHGMINKPIAWPLPAASSGVEYVRSRGIREIRVVGYVHRHLAQPPEGDPTDTRWRHSLMNWGHDPQKSR